jgi:hypothetical protein
MAEANLAGIRACVFDAHGTLFDVASAAAGCRDVPGDNADALDFARDTLGLNARRRRVVWCNRCDRRRENLPGQPAREIRALAELPAVLGA